MAVINQSPAGQSSVTLSGIVLDSIDATASPFWQSRKIVGSASVQLRFGGEQGGGGQVVARGPILGIPKIRVRS